MTRNIGFAADSFDTLAGYEDWHWWFQNRNDLILQLFGRFCRSRDQILEIGCGNGAVTGAIHGKYPNAELTATEFFEEGLVNARARVSGVTFRQLDARDLTDAEKFDVVCAFDVLEHIDQDVEVMTAVRSSMRDAQSRFVITVPQHMWLWSQADVFAKHERRYTFAEMRDKLEQAGFDVEYRTSYVVLLLPLMYLSRLLKKDESDFDPNSEFTISKTSNLALNAVLKVEAALRRIGLPMPAGGSLVVVAKPRAHAGRG